MASLQAYLAVWMIRWRVKRRLRGVRDYRLARKILRPDRYSLPIDVGVTHAEIGGVPGEWLESTKPASATLLYLHGGGYFGCSAESHRPITAYFARHGFRVFAPDYRLAPENPFPAAVEDATSVYRGLVAQGCAAQQLVVSGDSAGGGLALALMLTLRAAGTSLPVAAALFSPWTDLAATGESIHSNARRCAMFNGPDIGPTARYYLGKTDPTNPLASPLYADLTHLPPLLIHVGANETLRDDSTRLAERARAAGVPIDLRIFQVVPHAWQLLPHRMPEAVESLRESVAFLQRQIASPSAQSEKREAQHA